MITIPESFFIKNEATAFADTVLALDEPNGLIGIGGELSTGRLLMAYKKGIFPWYSEGEPILWYSPNPRMIIDKKSLKISKSLAKILKSNKFEIRIDTDFASVIKHCKGVIRKEQNGTWIDDKMLSAYAELHKLGFAKSVEVYENNVLVGGLYGVCLGRVFFGESMFSLKSNTSKIAFTHLVKNMDYQLIDCQVENPHLKSLGAFTIKRSLFNAYLQKLL